MRGEVVLSNKAEESSMLTVIPDLDIRRHVAPIDQAFRFATVEKKGREEDLRQPDGLEHDSSTFAKRIGAARSSCCRYP